MDPHTSIEKWISYHIIFGFGCITAFQLPQMAAQAVLPLNDVPIGAVFVSAGNNVLNSRLVEYIGALNIPSIDPKVVVSRHHAAVKLRSAALLHSD